MDKIFNVISQIYLTILPHKPFFSPFFLLLHINFHLSRSVVHIHSSSVTQILSVEHTKNYLFSNMLLCSTGESTFKMISLGSLNCYPCKGLVKKSAIITFEAQWLILIIPIYKIFDIEVSDMQMFCSFSWWYFTIFHQQYCTSVILLQKCIQSIS